MTNPGRDQRQMHESYVQMAQLVMPNDTNPYGTLSGGRLMHWIDVAGGISATRHARQLVVTAAIDHLVFHDPIPEGHIAVLEALVTCSGRTSMEVKVDVSGEDPVTGEISHTTTARLVYVAIENGVPIEVPDLIPSTPDEKAIHERAVHRRDLRTEARGKAES
jgi:acyl-CoA hydrolase